LVLGVDGQWGSGKSSYINILLSKILEDEDIDIEPTKNYRQGNIYQEIKDNKHIILLEP